MCEKCEGFKNRIRINTLYEYFDLLKQLKELIKDKNFRYVGKYTLEEIEKGKPFPDDFIEHIFYCTKCNQEFKLSVDNYHGSGGSWEAIET